MPVAAGDGRLKTTHAEREHAIDTLKAAFVQGRLTRDELDERLGETLASRTRAQLATVTADLPAGLAPARPPEPARAQARWPVNLSVRSGVCAVLVAFMLLALIVGGGHARPGPDAQACRAFRAWTGPVPDGMWLLDAAVASAQQGSNRYLLHDLRGLRQVVRQSGGFGALLPPGSGPDSLRNQLENATLLVNADCAAYSY